MGDELQLFRLTDIHIHGNLFLCPPPLTLHGLFSDGSCEFWAGRRGGREEGGKEIEIEGKRKEGKRGGGRGGGEGREKRRTGREKRKNRE